MRKQLTAAIAATAAASAIAFAPTASATVVDDYLDELNYNGMTIWNYPQMVQQGRIVCELLWDDIDPYPLLVHIGYNTHDAATIIVSAQATLCPGNAVTR
jgi:hypothetical protein